jgi:hypothetical protein
LEASSRAGYRCPVCLACLDLSGVERWVREAERERDRAYDRIGDGGFGEIVRGERQREVYRRRKVFYELQETPRAVARPEMVLVVYDERRDAYECRVYYKGPRSTWGRGRFSVGAAGEMTTLGPHADPVARLVGEKAAEFRDDRRKLFKQGLPVPSRRVFYASEL